MSENPAVGGGLPETAEALAEQIRDALEAYGELAYSYAADGTQQAQEAIAALSSLRARHAAERVVWEAAVGMPEALIVADLIEADRTVEQLEAEVAGLQARHADAEKERDGWKHTAEILQDTEAMADLFASEQERAEAAEASAARAEEALRGCIPWVATSGRGAAQEALAIACDLTGQDPYDWSSHPDVLARRIELLGWPDRRAGSEGGEQ